ncbi:MAG: hypothetical protein HEQ39_10925 [Rhizobacter sp.]
MTTTQLKSATAPLLLADASAIGMGWSKPSGVASDAKVKAYLGQVLHNLTGGKISSIDRLAEYTAGQRRSQLEASLNKEVASASGGRLTSWRQLLSAGSRELLERQTASSNPPANKPAPSNTPWKIGGVDVGAGARQVWNGVKNVPNPLLGGLTPNQAGQVLKGGINAGARTINQTVRAPVLPVAEPASSFESVRARADSWVARASKGKFDSVADLVHFAGDNKAANRLRGQVTQMLQKDAGAQAGGFSNWKQVLTAAERGQLERTLVETQKLPPTQPNTPKQQQAWAGQALQQVQKLPTPKSERGPLDTLRNVVGGAWDQFAGDTFKAEIEQLKKIVRDPSRLIKPIDDIKNWLESDPKGQWNNAIATWGRVFSHPPEKWAEAYKAELMKQPQTQMLREFSHKVRNDRDFQEQLAGRGLGLIAQVIVTRKVTKALQGNPGSAIQPIKQTPTAVATAGQGGLRLQAIKETLRSLGNEVTPSHVVKKLRQYMIDITDDLKTTPKGTARYKELADIRAQLDQRLNGRLKPTAVVPQPHPTGVNQPTPAIKPAPVSPTPIKSIAATPLQPLQPFAVHPSRVKLDALLEPMLKEAGLGAPSLARSDALRQFEQEVNKIGGADKLTTDKQRRELIQRAIGEATGAQPTTHTQPSKPTQPIKPIDTQPKTQPNNTAKPNLNPQPQPTPGQGQSTPNGSTAGVQGKPTPVIEVERPQTKVPPKAPDWSQLPPEGKLTQPSKGTVPVNTTPVASQEIPLVSPELHRALVKINDLLGPALIAVGLSEFSKERSDAINRVERAIEQAGGAEKLTSDWQRKQLIDQAIGLPAVKQPTVTATQPNSNSAPTPVTPQQPVKVPNKPTPLFEDSRYGGPSPYIDKVPAGTVGAQRNPNRPEGGNNIPGWSSMTPEQKVQTINRLIQQPITPAQELQIRAGVVPPDVQHRLDDVLRPKNEPTESTYSTAPVAQESEILQGQTQAVRRAQEADVVPLTETQRLANADNFYQEYAQHLKAIGAMVEGSSDDAVSRLTKSIIDLYGGPDHFRKGFKEQGPIAVGFAGGKDSSSIFQILRWLQLHVEKTHGVTFPMRSETMLQGGLPPSSLRLIDQIFRDTGSIGDSNAELIITSGRRMYEYGQMSQVMNEVRTRDAERIATATSMNYGMKPRASFCDLCNTMMLNANDMVLTPLSAGLKNAKAMLTGDSLEEVGLYLPWPVRIARSPTFNESTPLRDQIKDIREGYPGYQNLVLGIGDVLKRFYYPEGSQAGELFDFKPSTPNQQPVEWFQVYGQGFDYDAGINKPRLDKYFDFHKDNLALSLTESDCFHPLLGLVWQAQSMARLSNQGKLGQGIKLSYEQSMEALLKQHYLPLMFEKKIPPFLVQINLDRFLPKATMDQVNELIAQRPIPNALFNAQEVQQLTDIVARTSLDIEKTKRSTQLVNDMARQIYGYTPENVSFMLASPVANRGENLRSFLTERFPDLRPAQRTAIEHRMRQVLEGKLNDPVVEKWMEAMAAMKMPQLRHSYTQPIASPLLGASAAEVMQKLRKSSHPQDIIRVEDPYKRVIRIDEVGGSTTRSGGADDPVWLFIEGR